MEINDENYKEILAAGMPVVIDFWAPWCGPCKKIGPDVAALAEQYAGQVTVCKCNVDENEDVVVEYGIRNVPTLLFIKDGQVVDKQVGACTKAQLEEKLRKLL